MPLRLRSQEVKVAGIFNKWEVKVGAYGWLKFLHVLSVIVWIGGVAGLAVVTWRIARERNREALSALVRQSAAFGQGICGPASGVVLLTGLTMVGLAHLGFATLWIVWGYAGIAVHGFTGGIFLRKRVAELTAIASAPGGDEASLIGAARRLWTTQLVYLLLLATVVGAMILKPTL
jgi:uncharacterized membrane protein